MKKWIFITVAILFLTNLSHAELITQNVEYYHGEDVLEGYLAFDDSIRGKQPGIIVVHEWKGLGSYVKERTSQLAEMGYVAFAIDMYGKGISVTTHDEAAKISGMYREDRQLMRHRAEAGLNVLKAHPSVDPNRMIAIGYCFGGSTVLELARAGIDLKGIVSFHGGLSTPTPAEPGAIKAKVLVMHGAKDPFVSPEQMLAFKEEMIQSGADWQLVEFGDAVHSFTVYKVDTDASDGIAYNEKADKRSWKMMVNFFDEILKT